MPIEDIEQCISEGNEELSLQYSDEDPMTLAAELAQVVLNGKLNHVTSLDLGGNNLDVSAIEALGDMVFSGLPELKELDLRHNELGAAGVIALSGALTKNNRKLERLFLGENKLHDEGAHAALLLMLGLPNLTTLALGSNQLTPQICEQISKAILAQDKRVLTSLHLEFNGLGDTGLLALMAGLTDSRVGLKELNLSDNHISDEGIIHGLTPFLKSEHQVLEKVDLSVNKIGLRGAEALAEVITSTSTLQEIDLGCNLIGEEGGLAIARALETPSAMQSIDLTTTEMTAKVMGELMHAVTENPRILAIRTTNNDAVENDLHHQLQVLLKEVPRDKTPFKPSSVVGNTRTSPNTAGPAKSWPSGDDGESDMMTKIHAYLPTALGVIFGIGVAYAVFRQARRSA